MGQAGNVIDVGTTVGFVSSYWWYHLLTETGQLALIGVGLTVGILRIAVLVRDLRR